METTHVYEKAGTYVVTLTVRDHAGNLGSHSLTVTGVEESSVILVATTVILVVIVATAIILVLRRRSKQ